eukprot:CAMPEP_0119073820 /NCGR_PEP_ID=MMETSP1178-20130426/69140_1 /TAXON_ID=33656 /ORGANISM="unid sp, Strain CCMP2000" /LENGTH=341 /DNA_ID=CAMNT_0007055937 /DNA_START=69 /DNA_END=1094 /DNA_ORIENTATION=+
MVARSFARAVVVLQLCGGVAASHEGRSHGVMNIGVVTVPQQSMVVVERLGKFHRMLPAGLHFTMPYPIDHMRMHDLRERPYHLAKTPGITRDNVDLIMDGVVYLRIVDAYRANYAVSDPIEAMLILAQTTVRSKIGEMTLDQTFKNREELNAHVVNELRRVGAEWGIECTRYEVKDIDPPLEIMTAMKAEAEAERKKRAAILESEGVRQAQINRAEGEKQARVLDSEAERQQMCNLADGKASAVRAAAQAESERTLLQARAKAKSIRIVARSLELQPQHGENAVRLALASEYVRAFSKLAQGSSTLVVPADAASIPSMISQAMSALNELKPSTGRVQASKK